MWQGLRIECTKESTCITICERTSLKKMREKGADLSNSGNEWNL